MPNPLSYGIYNGTYIRPLLVDSSGRTIVQGYKDNVLQAYHDRVALYHEDLNLLVGTNTYNFAAVPAGEIHVLTACWFKYNATIAALQMRFILFDGVTEYIFINQTGPTANQGYSYQTNVTFKAGDNLRIVITNCVAGNDVFISALGYSTLVP